MESERGHAGRKKFFDRVMRDGVLTGYFHAAEHPAIVEIIVSQLSVFVLKMGIQSVKHLKVFCLLPLTSPMSMLTFAKGCYPYALNYSNRSIHYPNTSTNHYISTGHTYTKYMAKNWRTTSSEKSHPSACCMLV